jgi:hypothetical protein
MPAKDAREARAKRRLYPPRRNATRTQAGHSFEIGLVAPHGGGDRREIRARHAHDAEAERRAPVVLVADERETLEQRLDRRRCRIEVGDAAPIRGRRIDGRRLVDRTVADASDGGERLQRLAGSLPGARLLNREAVAGLHALERPRLADGVLDEAVGEGGLRVVARHDSDPVAAFVHERLLSRFDAHTVGAAARSSPSDDWPNRTRSSTLGARARHL